MSYNAGPELGTIEVHTTEEGGHPVEFWSNLCIERIVQVSQEAPEEIQNQVKDCKMRPDRGGIHNSWQKY